MTVVHCTAPESVLDKESHAIRAVQARRLRQLLVIERLTSRIRIAWAKMVRIHAPRGNAFRAASTVLPFGIAMDHA
jgi:hypothetical protein